MLLILIMLGFYTAKSDESQQFIAYVNNVGPYSNPTETYRYYSLPYCQPDELQYGDQTLGEALSGDRKMNSLYNFTFKQNSSRVLLCSEQLNSLTEFEKAISENYIAEFYIGNI